MSSSTSEISASERSSSLELGAGSSSDSGSKSGRHVSKIQSRMYEEFIPLILDFPIVYKWFGVGVAGEARRKRKFTLCPTKKFNDIG